MFLLQATIVKLKLKRNKNKVLLIRNSGNFEVSTESTPKLVLPWIFSPINALMKEEVEPNWKLS